MLLDEAIETALKWLDPKADPPVHLHAGEALIVAPPLVQKTRNLKLETWLMEQGRPCLATPMGMLVLAAHLQEPAEGLFARTLLGDLRMPSGLLARRAERLFEGLNDGLPHKDDHTAENWDRIFRWGPVAARCMWYTHCRLRAEEIPLFRAAEDLYDEVEGDSLEEWAKTLLEEVQISPYSLRALDLSLLYP